MNFVGHVFNVPIPRDFEHVENVLHEKFAIDLHIATHFQLVAVVRLGIRLAERDGYVRSSSECDTNHSSPSA